MADDSSSSIVAIVAIVIIVFLAIAGYYFFMGSGVSKTETVITNEPSRVEVTAPTTDTSPNPAPSN
ncbi:MAG: hypothetical protein H0W64_03955 [Gammaproteobacteria bacterium]|nr:hypothetical protein [Gammaproteobacteria bacterium]